MKESWNEHVSQPSQTFVGLFFFPAAPFHTTQEGIQMPCGRTDLIEQLESSADVYV